MSNFWYYLTQPSVLSVIGLLLFLAFTMVSMQALQLAAIWIVAALALIFTVWLVIWIRQRRKAQVAAENISDIFRTESQQDLEKTPGNRRHEVDVLHRRMKEAVTTIKQSRLGQLKGNAALYELPWYIVIGNPAAGKSSAIINSGLHFPFADESGSIVQGIGGTRNCDWFFTSEGIFLDTAGRYSVHEEDQGEWLSFLMLLKRYRAKAPINGIVLVTSVVDLVQNRPEYAINMAKKLRQRVQELTSDLGVFAPVYVIFTKIDLISGFSDFFAGADPHERERVWGASLPYDPENRTNCAALFDKHFEELYDGLREVATTRMAERHGETVPPGVLSFPLEFSAIHKPLRSFIVTLFQDNPFQFQPIFRGFYFTSACQEGTPINTADERLAHRFGLRSLGVKGDLSSTGAGSYYLKDLFSRVIFADSQVVRQYISPRKRRLRYAAFFGSAAALGLGMGVITWSYIHNSKLIASVQSDLQKVAKIQEGRVDLASRFEAQDVLLDRIEQMERFNEETPFALSFGLYQGERLTQELRSEYFQGMREIMLRPVVESLEAYLTDVTAHADQLKPQASGTATNSVSLSNTPPKPTSFYQDFSPTNSEEAYNALKTYLMLAQPDRIEVGHLADQITRHWRAWLDNNRGAMSREQMARSVERMLTYGLSQAAANDFPLIQNRLALVDQAREALRKVVRGASAKERVYAEIKARASTRFPIVTVSHLIPEQDKNVIYGGHAISGAFTRAAWTDYIQEAIKQAANQQLQSTDWVLKTSVQDDLTLEGSPEHIEKSLQQMYKADFVSEWTKFMQGITIGEFANFNEAVARMNRLGDPVDSPVNALMSALFEQTSWDNPTLANQQLQRTQTGIIRWFKDSILRQAPARVDVKLDVNAQPTNIPMGQVGQAFAPIAALMTSRNNSDATLLKGYLDRLSQIRSRLNQIKTAGDIGPPTKVLMQDTLGGNHSELAEALGFVDENMLTGMTDEAKAIIRPLLVRPLIQAFAVLIQPTEEEINRTWVAQVHRPFSQTLQMKYPFSEGAGVEARPEEIAQYFGPQGAVAKFSEGILGPLVQRRGDTIAPRTWADLGIRLLPSFTANYARFVNADGRSSEAVRSPGGDAHPQQVFQIRPRPVAGLFEYTIEIDGHALRYRNAVADWEEFQWPGAGQPGAKITGVNYNGEPVEIANYPGYYGLEKLINAAVRKRQADGAFDLSWTNGGNTVTVDLKIISSTQVDSAGEARGHGMKNLTLPAKVAGQD